MPNGFNISAKVILSAGNVSPVVSSIQRQLKNINASVNITLPKNIGSQISSLNSQLQNLNQNLNNISKTSGTAGLNKIGSGMSNVAKQSQLAKSAVFELGESVGQAARKFATFSLAAGALTGLVLAMKDGISAAINYQHQMIRLQQVSDGARAGIKEISDEITKLSTTLGTSSAELSKLSVTLRQAGLSAQDTKDALSAIASTSVAPTFNDINNTVEGTIVLMQQFNVKAKDLKDTLGSINRVSADFAVESDDIVHALRRSGGAFASAGGNVRELIALFTSVRQTTRESAETIASGFNTIFARLQRPQAVEQLRLMGIELRNTAQDAKDFGKTEGEFVGPYEAIKRLNQALKNVPTGSPEFAAIVEQIGGFRQVSKVIPLIQQFGVAEKAMGSAIYGQTSLVRSNILAQQSLTVQINKLQEEFLNLFRVLGANKTLNEFAKGFLFLATGVTKAVAAFEPLIPLLATLATVKLVSTLGNFATPGFVSGVKSGLSKNKPFAAGGLVPGVGDQDSVHARLTPGEFVLRKSAVKAIGPDQLHKMNQGGISKFAFGGRVATQYFDDGGKASSSGILVRNPNFNRALVRPPGGKVGMFVTNADYHSDIVATPIVPIDNLGSQARTIFDKDKSKLVASKSLSQQQADQIKSVSVPIAIRSPAEKQARDVRGLIDHKVINALDDLAGTFSEESAGIHLGADDAQRIMREAVTAQGVGRIFEGFLKVVAAKTGGSKDATSARANFDLDPVDAKGLSGLFGNDTYGLSADIKLNDNAQARASVVSKAVRKYGISTNVGLDQLSKKYTVPGKQTNKINIATGQREIPKDVILDPLDYAQKLLGKKKFAAGGLVEPVGFADGDEVLKQKQYFSLHEDSPIGVSRGVLAKLFADPTYKFTDKTISDLVSKGKTRRSISSNTKRREEFAATKAGPKTLKIPFPGDVGLGVIGKHTGGSAGPVSSLRSIDGILAETKNDQVAKDLERLNVDKVNMAFTRHVVSKNITSDFDKTLQGPVSSAIKTAFTSRFGDVLKDLQLQKSEISSLEGVLFEKYISGVTKNVLGQSKGGKDAIFDFPHGFPAGSSINTVVFPKVSPSDRIDAKLDLSQPRVENSLAGKYLSYNINKLGRFAQRKVQAEPQTPEFSDIQQRYEKFQSKLDLLRKHSGDSPGNKKKYEEAIDYSIALKRQLATRDTSDSFDLPKGYKAYAAGGVSSIDPGTLIQRGKIQATAKHYASGGEADSVPAMVMPGEFIFSREAAQRIGYGKLHNMNKYAKGGTVNGDKTFRVDVMDQTGKEFVKEVKAASQEAAQILVRAHGLFVTSIKDITGGQGFFSKIFGRKSELLQGQTSTQQVDNTSKRINYKFYPPNLARRNRQNAYQANERGDGYEVLGLHERPSGNGSYPIASRSYDSDQVSKGRASTEITGLLREILGELKKDKFSGSGKVLSGKSHDVSNITSQEEKIGFGARLKSFSGYAAVAGLQYAPLAIEKGFGTIERAGSDPNKRYHAQTGAAIGEALSSGATGAAIGSAGGTYGIVIGAVIGGLYGLFSSLDETSKQIREIDFAKDLKKFSFALQRATADDTPLSSRDVADIRRGIEKTQTEASTKPNKDLFYAENTDVGQLQTFLAKAARTANIKSTDSESVQRSKILESQGGAGRDVASFLRQLPEFKDQNLEQILAPFAKIGVDTDKDKSRALISANLESAVKNQIHSFSQLGVAVDRAAARLEELNTSLDVTVGLGEGNFKTPQVSKFSRAAAGFGTASISPADFGRSIDFITGPAKSFGGKLSEDFSSSTKNAHEVLAKFPEILGSLIHKGVNEETLGANLNKAILEFVPHADEGVRNKLKAAATEGFTPAELLKKIGDDLPGLIEDITKKAFSGFGEIASGAAKKLEDNLNAYSASIAKYQELGVRLGEAQDRYVDLQLELAGTTKRFVGERSGLSNLQLTPSQQQIPFNLRQTRLTGFTGGAATDPNAIANKFSALSGKVREALEQKNNLPASSGIEAITAADAKLQSLASASSRLQTALQHLADPVQRNAALQERLNQINEESAQRQSLAERYYTATPQERFKLDQTANVANAVATGGVSADVLSPELKQAVFSLSHDLEEIPTLIFGGLKGKDFRQQFFSQNPLTQGIANLPAGRENEKQNLQGAVVDNIKVAIEAQGKLAGIIENTQKTFFTELQTNQKAFLSEFRKNLLESNLGEAQGRATSAAARSETLVKAQSAGQFLDSAGLGNFDKGRKLVRDPEFTALAANVKKQADLDNIIKNNNFAPNIGQGDIDKATTKTETTALTPDFRRVTIPSTQINSAPLIQILTKQLGGYEAAGKITGNEITKILEDFKSRVETPGFDPSSKNINATAAELFNQVIKTQKEQTDAAVKVQTESVQTTHNLRTPNDTLYLARNQQQIEKGLETVKDYSDIGSLNTAAKNASDGLVGLVAGIQALKAELDKFGKPKEPSIVNNAINNAVTGASFTAPQAFTKGGLVQRKLNDLLKPEGTDKFLAKLSANEAVIPANSVANNKGLVNRLINSDKPVLAANGYDPETEDPFEKTATFLQRATPLGLGYVGVGITRAAINYGVKPAINLFGGAGYAFAEAAGANYSAPALTTKTASDYGLSVKNLNINAEHDSIANIVANRESVAFRNRATLRIPEDQKTDIAASQLDEQRKTLNSQIANPYNLNVLTRKKLFDDNDKFDASDVGRRGKEILANALPPMQSRNVIQSPISSPAELSSTTGPNKDYGNLVPASIANNPKIPQAIKDRIAAQSAARNKQQSDNQAIINSPAVQSTSDINYTKIIGDRIRAIDERTTNQIALQKSYIDKQAGANFTNRYANLDNRNQANAGQPKLSFSSRKTQRLAASIDFATQGANDIKPENISGQDLHSVAVIHQQFEYELSRKNISQNTRKLLESKRDKFSDSVVGLAFDKETELRAGTNIPQFATPYQFDTKRYKNKKSNAYKTTHSKNLAAQAIYEQNLAAIQAPVLSHLSGADLATEKAKKYPTIAERQVAIRNRGTSFTVAAQGAAINQIHGDQAQHKHIAGHNPRFEEEQKKREYHSGYSSGGKVNEDDRMIAVNGNEFVVNASATNQHLQLLKNINSGKGITYRANGGLVGGSGLTSSNTTSSSTNGTISLASEGIAALTGFGQSVDKLGEPLRVFGTAVSGMTGVVAGIQQIVGPLNVFSQNIQTIKAPFDGFSTAATNLSAGLALFNKNADTLSAAMSSLANLPSTITVQGTTQVNVAVTGAEAFATIKNQVMEEVIAVLSAKLKPEIISSLKSGAVA